MPRNTNVIAFASRDVFVAGTWSARMQPGASCHSAESGGTGNWDCIGGDA